MRNKKRSVIIMMIVTVILICIASGVFIVSNKSTQKNEEKNISNNVYNEKVDRAIDSVLFSADYNTLSLDNKKDRMLSVLYKLEEDGEILKDSIFYQEECKIIWFQYSDGFQDGVELEECSHELPY